MGFIYNKHISQVLNRSVHLQRIEENLKSEDSDKYTKHVNSIGFHLPLWQFKTLIQWCGTPLFTKLQKAKERQKFKWTQITVLTNLEIFHFKQNTIFITRNELYLIHLWSTIFLLIKLLCSNLFLVVNRHLNSI